MQPAIIVHSGAGYFPDNRNEFKLEVTKLAALTGWRTLLDGDNVMDAVEAAVRVMEDNAECNAGYGSVLNSAGDVEMDAMIIRGKDLATGGVGALCKIQNPIMVARRILEKTPHVLISGSGALDFAIRERFVPVSNESLVSPRAKLMLEAVLANKMAASTETGGEDASKESVKEKGLGTVGAVAINSFGELAAATSTGGICAKIPGRIGDTPIPGGGTFCDDQICGISATGLGESIMRVCLCSRIANLISNGMDPSVACLTALNSMTDRVGGDGGAIVITKDGVMTHVHNSKKMTWASISGNELRCGVKTGEEFVEVVPTSE